MNPFKQGQIVRYEVVDCGLLIDHIAPISAVHGNYVEVSYRMVHFSRCRLAEPVDMYPYGLPRDALYAEMRRGVIDCCGRSTVPDRIRNDKRYERGQSMERVTRRRYRRERKHGIVKGPIMNRVNNPDIRPRVRRHTSIPYRIGDNTPIGMVVNIDPNCPDGFTLKIGDGWVSHTDERLK